MWIVVRNWDGHEASVEEFDNEEEAREHYSSLEGDTEATMYLAKVEKLFEG